MTEYTDHADTLTALLTDDCGWCVEDSEGGVWHPTEEITDTTETGAREALRRCRETPMAGVWVS